MTELFVYGTLRYGERNHAYLNGATLVNKQCRVKGSLYETKNNYPVLVQSEASNVYGELYQITQKQLNKIDFLEGYKENNANNLFERKKVTVINDQGVTTQAYTYMGYNGSINPNDMIKSGDWKVHKYLKQSEFLYIAYGSCMDNERFALQGVDQYFKAILGCGILDGYELKFSRSSSDGGKADIIENKNEKVEGKVYLVPMDAITYLYKREGVYTKAYRPIIVDIAINGQIKQAITFTSTQKDEETAPTVNYATEIIRGSSGFVSDAYKEKLQKKINALLKQ